MNQTTLKGGPELLAFLEAFPKNMQKNALRAGLRAAAAPIREQARSNVPVKSGKLRKAVKSSSPIDNKDGTISIKVRLKGPHAYLGTFIEYGVAPHLITAGDSNLSTRALNKRAKKSGVLGKTKTGLIRVGGYEYMTGVRGQRDEGDTLKIRDSFIGGAVMHPGFPAHPFLRPALDVKAQDAINAFGNRIREYLKDKANFSAPSLAVEGEE
ncbi:HK97-gp10 family putative phage morphogenesis protein [Novosphingobium sp. KN65.2]|uniref:HK97-gp10 family putative phage morphogenesis protein n=1 Tax=Novosphingobium sp. KN65.2 TaxID=1478134 RepID=UPI0005DB738E|nr:HK97-gp10 family putative phage morphogenesis protein [Novosphingobium sp. KN65.2]CDO37145.1 Phage protein, HK97, gp10 [Novosphingobium sp. KN65.2]